MAAVAERAETLRLPVLPKQCPKLAVTRRAIAEVFVGGIAETSLLPCQGDQRLARRAPYSLRVWVGAAEDLVDFIFERTLIVRRRT